MSRTPGWGEWSSGFRRLRRDRRTAPVILGVAMAVSAVLTLSLGHGTTFSGDEVVWVGASPGLDPYIVFQPHGGHLIAVTRLVYWPILELFGLDYLPFRALSVGAILLAVRLLFAYGRRRTDEFVALAPCLILLFFGSDYLHLFQGNGFTVMLAMAFGLAALLTFWRGDSKGDRFTCLWLSLGALTYTVILPFIAGIGLAILLRRDRWRRIWLVLVPTAGYMLWRAWLLLADVGTDGGGIVSSNALRIPAWCFQSLSGILNALTGLSYPFAGVGLSAPVDLAGPPLAVGALVFLGFVLSRRGLRLGLLVALAVATSLFAIQAMAASPVGADRLPGSDSRYMYPGAIVVILIGFELVRGWSPSPRGLLALALITASGIGANVVLMGDHADTVRDSGEEVRTYAGAFRLLLEGEPPGEATVDYRAVGESPVSAIRAMVLQDYGTFGYDPGELRRQPESRAVPVDRFLADPLTLSPVAGGQRSSRGCERSRPDATGEVKFEAGPGRLVLSSPSGGPVRVGRFAESPSVDIGSLEPTVAAELILPEDSAPDPWQIVFTGPELEVCRTDE